MRFTFPCITILLSGIVLMVGCGQAAGMGEPAATLPPPTPTTPPPPGEILWSFQSDGAIWGSPSIGNNTIYIGSDDRRLYAIEAHSGRLKWKYETGGLVRSQPAIADQRIYFSSDDGYLYALESEHGLEQWRVDIGNISERAVLSLSVTSSDFYDYRQSSPAIADGWIYIGSADGNVYALDADTGEIRWKFQTGEKVRATPTVENGIVYIGSWDGFLYALDAKSGQLHWKYDAAPHTDPPFYYRPIQTKALVYNGLVYCASRKASIFALDIQTGALKWEHRYGNGIWVESSPVVQDGILYIGSSASQFVLALDAQSGEPRGILPTQTFNWGTPAIADNVLYIGGTVYQKPQEKAGLMALQIDDGRITGPLWHLSVGATLDASGQWIGVASSPIVSGNVVYFGSLDGKLYAVSTGP